MAADLPTPAPDSTEGKNYLAVAGEAWDKWKKDGTLYDDLRTELKQEEKRDLPKAFLDNLQKTNPALYQSLLEANRNPKDGFSPFTKEQLKLVDAFLDVFEMHNMVQTLEAAGVKGAKSLSFVRNESGGLSFSLPLTVADELTVEQIPNGTGFSSWKIGGIDYTQQPAKRVFENAAHLQKLVAEVANGKLTSTEEAPFVVSAAGVLSFNNGGLLDQILPSIDLESFSSADHPEQMAAFLNRAYVDVRRNLAIHDKLKRSNDALTKISQDQNSLSLDYVKSLANPVYQLNVVLGKDGYPVLPKGWEFVDAAIPPAQRSNWAFKKVEAAGTPTNTVTPPAAASEAPAAVSDAPAAQRDRVPAAPEAAGPKTPAEFAAMLHENGNAEKYMTQTTVSGDTHVVLHLPTADDRRMSRIQHFVGRDGVALVGLDNPANYVLKSGGAEYHWGADKQGTPDTWVDSQNNRLLVVDGTTFDVHLQEAPAVADASATGPVSTEKVATAAPASAPTRTAEVQNNGLDADEQSLLAEKIRHSQEVARNVQTEIQNFGDKTPEAVKVAAQQRLGEVYNTFNDQVAQMGNGVPAEQFAAFKRTNQVDQTLVEAKDFVSDKPSKASQPALADGEKPPVVPNDVDAVTQNDKDPTESPGKDKTA